MHFELVLLLLSSPLPTHALSLVDTLRNQAGASQFAQIIESNTELLALVQSNTLTVFAPTDKNSRLASLQRRDTDNQKDARQIQEGLTNIQSFSTKPGVVVKTEDRSGNLNGNPQAVVAHSGQFADPRFNLQNARIRRTIGNFTYEPVTISSGLGNNVSIIREDIPYDGGIIQVVNECVIPSPHFFIYVKIPPFPPLASFWIPLAPSFASPSLPSKTLIKINMHN